jgi:3-hydroxyisobutyrate dehydrogenase-like beta-hydroxyacid dehydrogenase
MARTLARAGEDVWGRDIRPASDFGDFAPRMLASARALAERCPTVLSVVRDRTETETLCLGEGGLFTAEPYPALLVVCSTLAPADLLAVAARLPKDVVVVDAAISGAPVAAEEGTLSVMMGGPDAALDALTPLFAKVAKAIHHMGPLGTGMTVKVLNNFVAASSVMAVRRVFAGAEALGMDWRAVRDVMATSSGATWFGGNYDRISWADEGYAPDNTMAILEKDVKAYLTTVTAGENRRPDPFEEAVLSGLRTIAPTNRKDHP